MLFVGLLFLQVVIVGGSLLIQPYVTRRGLLFGVYVGEERWGGDQARAITRQWMTGMLAGMAGGVVLALLMVTLGLGPEPAGLLVSVLVLLLTSYGVYLRAYFRAKTLAVAGVPAAAAALVVDRPSSLVLPLASLTIAACCGRGRRRLRLGALRATCRPSSPPISARPASRTRGRRGPSGP